MKWGRRQREKSHGILDLRNTLGGNNRRLTSAVAEGGGQETSATGHSGCQMDIDVKSVAGPEKTTLKSFI